MDRIKLSPEARNMLKQVSVATLTTCLFKRGFKNQLIQNVRPIDPRGSRLVGEAFTLRTIPAREDLATPAVLADRKYAARAAIEACPPGHVLVIDSRKDVRGASGGDILMTRLQVRGVAGCVTDARPCAFAIPKSSTLVMTRCCAAQAKNRFPGLTSRWTMPCK